MSTTNSKGIGKGTLPPPPGKGKGKARSVESSGKLLAPPPEFQAPIDASILRLEHALPSAEGTMWEGLDAWGRPCSDVVLEGLRIDRQLFSALWAPMPAPPVQAAAVAAQRQLLPADLSRRAEIAWKVAKLTPQLVETALTRDMNAITQEQAFLLYHELYPVALQATGLLSAAVNRSGEDSLRPAEALLWRIVNIPLAEVRAKLLAEQYVLDEELDFVKVRVEKVQWIVSMLASSRAVKTVLQAILAARNILGQQGHEGYGIKSFINISHQRLSRNLPPSVDPVTGALIPVSLDWIHANNPSVLTLAAEMLETAHVYRCRLRFLRMVAIGNTFRSEHLCKLIWSYVDDLKESPRDALGFFSECSGFVCNSELHTDVVRQSMKLRFTLNRDFQLLEQSPSVDVRSNYYEQLMALRRRVAESLETCNDYCTALEVGADNLGRLAGQRVQLSSGRAFDNASDILSSLKFLGQSLERELQEVQRKRRVEAATATADRDIGEVRRWQKVDTARHLLMKTNDLDLIRQLRRELLVPATAPAASEAPAAPEVSEAPAAAVEATVVYSALHGGIEGHYTRDPLTGHWGRRCDGLDGTTALNLNLGGPSPSL